jgi:ribosomal protein L40E
MRTRSVITLSWAQTAALNPAKPICRTCGAELAPSSTRLRSLHCDNCLSLDNTENHERYLAPSAAREFTVASAGA